MATRLNNFAAIRCAQGHYEEAESVYSHALAVAEKSLGGDHPTTRVIRENYEGLKAEMAAKGGGGA